MRSSQGTTFLFLAMRESLPPQRTVQIVEVSADGWRNNQGDERRGFRADPPVELPVGFSERLLTIHLPDLVRADASGSVGERGGKLLEPLPSRGAEGSDEVLEPVPELVAQDLRNAGEIPSSSPLEVWARAQVDGLGIRVVKCHNAIIAVWEDLDRGLRLEPKGDRCLCEGLLDRLRRDCFLGSHSCRCGGEECDGNCSDEEESSK